MILQVSFLFIINHSNKVGIPKKSYNENIWKNVLTNERKESTMQQYKKSKDNCHKYQQKKIFNKTQKAQILHKIKF